MRSGGFTVAVPDGSVETWAQAQQLEIGGTRVTRLDVFAPSGNTGSVYVGFKGTVAGALPAGAELTAGDSYSFQPPNGGVFSTSDIWVAGVTDGDRLTWNAWE